MLIVLIIGLAFCGLISLVLLFFFWKERIKITSLQKQRRNAKESDLEMGKRHNDLVLRERFIFVKRVDVEEMKKTTCVDEVVDYPHHDQDIKTNHPIEELQLRRENSWQKSRRKDVGVEVDFSELEPEEPKNEKKVVPSSNVEIKTVVVDVNEKEEDKEMKQESGGGGEGKVENVEAEIIAASGDAPQEFVADRSIVGKMSGRIKALEVKKKESNNVVTNLFKGLVGEKTLTAEDAVPALEKLRDHLISKNVDADVAAKICESVAKKLEGKVLGIFQTVNATVRNALEESLLSLLQPKNPVDILRDTLECKGQQRPFVITFCGVNGVGKTTNLAKICFWLIENDLRVLVAACDTFRAGAVEQLRTHARHLNALHPPKNGTPMVQLYEKGYGKDAAGVAAEAISFAKDARIDVVLVDTAGRMQDNEPLMRDLSKLIQVNDPDLVLFVGEALVGNEAADQLVKFNRALADFSEQNNSRLIDGIILTKFDTVDDKKVGAAVSMAYITGQPILFVGTGQTYTDLRTWDSHAVVNSLMA